MHTGFDEKSAKLPTLLLSTLHVETPTEAAKVPGKVQSKGARFITRDSRFTVLL